jgi:hypothetical protein
MSLCVCKLQHAMCPMSLCVCKNLNSNHNFYVSFAKEDYLCARLENGGLAHLARALAWHAKGDEFDPRILHRFFTTN